MEPYVAWLLLGFALIIVEMTSGTFYLLVLGLACFGAAAASFLGSTFLVQILIAAAVSAIGIYAIHLHRGRNAVTQMMPIDAGMPAKFEAWTDQATGRARVRYRDASWEARLAAGTAVQPGNTVYVRSVDGNTLHVDLSPPN